MRINNEITTYLTARNRVLRELDIEGARRLNPEMESSDAVVLIALHKARYECTMIEPELRHASRAWLAARGYNGLTGPLLPKGALPK